MTSEGAPSRPGELVDRRVRTKQQCLDQFWRVIAEAEAELAMRQARGGAPIPAAARWGRA